MNLKQLISGCGSLLRKNTVLKIISVLLAIVVWIYILYIVNPVNENSYDRIEVAFAYPGSVPERNGLMYLMTDNNLTVSVKVSGSRSKLMRLSAEDIRATLNMDSVVSAGTYNISVNVSVYDSDISVTEIYPQSFTIEFAERKTKTVPVELDASGELPEGYMITGQSFSPKEVTISGPAATISEIDRVTIPISQTNVREDIIGSYDISLLNALGENIDRKYLTISDEKIETVINIQYYKELPLTVDARNVSGGTESYITTSVTPQTVTAIGSEKVLAELSEVSLGTLDTGTLLRSGDHIFTLPEIPDVIFDKDQATVHVEFSDGTATKTVYYPDVTKFICLNLPASKTPKIQAKGLSIRIRALSTDLAALNAETLICSIDLARPNEDGSYPVRVSSSDGTPFGVLGSYSVNVSLE